MWIRLDGLGYVQQKYGQTSHFRAFGLDPKVFEELPDADPLNATQSRTSLVHFCRYFPWSQFYGIPPIMPAWWALALMTLLAEFNIQFFTNNAIPDYVVILEGEWGTDVEDKIKEYFRSQIKGQAHKTMVLNPPDGCKVTFSKLTSDNAREGSFRLMRQDCRDEILNAHGVPPLKVGIHEPGRMGGNASSEQMEEYKQSIVLPGQQAITDGLNQVISVGFQKPDAQIVFEPFDTADLKANAEIDVAYAGISVLTPNEIRKERYPDKDPLPGGDTPLVQSKDLVDAAGELQKAIRSAIR